MHVTLNDIRFMLYYVYTYDIINSHLFKSNNFLTGSSTNTKNRLLFFKVVRT